MLMKRWKRSQLRGKDKSQSDTPSPCLCVPLHLNCDPVLCSEAPSHTTLQALGCEHLAKSEPNEPKVLVECTLSDIRKAALQRCSTCGILYTGLQNPKSRRRRGNDDDVQVRIKTNGNVDIYNTVNGYFYGEYDFFASASSDFQRLCQAFPLYSTLSSDTASEASYQTVMRWMEDCQNHEKCKGSKAVFLPARVLDVGPHDQLDFTPYLFESDGFEAEYVTLSHCWGNKHMVTTTKDSLPRRKEGIDVSLLPNTFADAITITRTLKFRYLWIDSLCIIQDDALDWQQESKKMANIYQDSALTIAASAAPDGEYGCFCRTSKLCGETSWDIKVHHATEGRPWKLGSGRSTTSVSKNVDTNIRIHQSSNKSQGGSLVSLYNASDPAKHQVVLHIVPNDIDLEEYPKSAEFVQSTGIFVRPQLDHSQFAASYSREDSEYPLSSRAWAFQERLLSTRILHYTESELIWECKSRAQCQCGRIGSQVHYFTPLDPKPVENLKTTFESYFDGHPTAEQLRYKWANIVFHYSSRDLSHDSDRLPALSGLGRLFREYDLGAYAAGLWERHIPWHLLWFTSNRGVCSRASTYTAPSWSWASVNIGVWFAEQENPVEGESAETPKLDIIGVVLDVHCIPAGLDPLSAVSYGCLKVRSKMIEATLLTANNTARKRRFVPGEEQRLRKPDRSTKPEIQEKPEEPEIPRLPTPYLFRIVNNTDGTSYSFWPDSISDIDVLTSRQPVFCLLWGRKHEVKMPHQENADIACLILVLRPSKAKFSAYERIGLLRALEYDEAGTDLAATEGLGAQKEPVANIADWFISAETVEIDIV